jgi:hypothetical protein
MEDFMSTITSEKAYSFAGFIFRAWRRDRKTGEVLWAKDYGLKAWKIPILARRKGKREEM